MKNTMIGAFADLFCPLSCIACGGSGSLLCECCRKNLCLDYGECLRCGQKLKDSICNNCEMAGSKQLCLGSRSGAVKELINLFKYRSLRRAGRILASLLLEAEDFTNNNVIVPLPTISRHVRERGYGHIELLAKYLVKNSSATCENLLIRAKNTVQVGADSEKRQSQAKEAYALRGSIDPKKHYCLLDDVWTTGSSMLSAIKILRSAGAQYVNTIVIAKTV